MGLTRVLLLLAPLTCATITPNGGDNEPVNNEPVYNGPDSLSQLFGRVIHDVSIIQLLLSWFIFEIQPRRRTKVVESKMDYLQSLALGIMDQLQTRHPELGPVKIDEVLEMKMDETLATLGMFGALLLLPF